MKPRGTLVVDEGATRALANGKSLLPAGVVTVTGQFGRGDPVSIEDRAGHRIAVGLCNYAAAEVSLIKGLQTDAVIGALGYAGRTALIHRNDMAI